MKATEMLKAEHRVIERVLAALDGAAQRLEQGLPLRPGFFTDAADFIKGFADGCHHRKEEGVLFAAMQAGGMPADVGPIAVMLAEHEEGRAYTRDLRAAAERLGAGDESARAEVVRSARDFVALLQQHIAKEDGILFPMAARVIPAAEHDDVVERFARVEHEETGPGVHQRYLALADSLEKELAAQTG